MTVQRAFTILVASGLGFGVAGAAIGFLIGRLAPDFYRMMLHRRMEDGVPVDFAGIGLAMGLIQGLMTGVGVGLVVVVVVGWLAGRRPSGAGSTVPEMKAGIL